MGRGGANHPRGGENEVGTLAQHKATNILKTSKSTYEKDGRALFIKLGIEEEGHSPSLKHGELLEVKARMHPRDDL